MLHDETNIVLERHNRRHITETTLLQTAVLSILSKKGGKELKKKIAALNVVTKAIDFIRRGPKGE